MSIKSALGDVFKGVISQKYTKNDQKLTFLQVSAGYDPDEVGHRTHLQSCSVDHALTHEKIFFEF